MPNTRATSQLGFTYVWTLGAVLVLAVSLAAVGEAFRISVLRGREAELLFVGGQFREAIRRYQAVSPNGAKAQYPPSLEDLLKDPRFPGVVRHLRRIYTDPMTGTAQWGFVRVAGRIAGVHSLSEAQPIKQNNFEPADESFRESAHYSDWVFMYPPDLVLKTSDPARNAIEERAVAVQPVAP